MVQDISKKRAQHDTRDLRQYKDAFQVVSKASKGPKAEKKGVKSRVQSSDTPGDNRHGRLGQPLQKPDQEMGKAT